MDALRSDVRPRSPVGRHDPPASGVSSLADTNPEVAAEFLGGRAGNDLAGVDVRDRMGFGADEIEAHVRSTGVASEVGPHDELPGARQRSRC